MPNFASVLKQEIRRLARKEAKLLIAPLKKALRAERKAAVAVRKQVAAAAKAAKAAGKRGRALVAAAATPEPAGKTRGGRALAEGWRKDTVRSTRKALGLTQGQFAKLVGVSQITVSFWETGRSTPRMTQQTAVLAARDQGRDKALAALGLPPGYKARRGRPSKADMQAMGKAMGKKRGRKAAKKKKANGRRKGVGVRARKK